LLRGRSAGCRQRQAGAKQPVEDRAQRRIGQRDVPEAGTTRICASYSQVLLQVGHLPGFESLSSLKVNPHDRHRAGSMTI